MNINLARIIDDCFGPPICLGLAVAKFFLARLNFSRNEGPKEANEGEAGKKILLIKFYGMGSIIMVTPVIRAIKKKYPGSKIYFLTFAENEGLCRMIEYIDEVITLNIHSKFVSNAIVMLARLWREKFDIVFDFEFFANFTAIVTFFTMCSKAVGFYTAKFWRNGFYSNTVAFDHSRHVVDIFIKAARAMEINDVDKTLERLRAKNPLKKKRIAALMEKNGILEGDFKICLNINVGSLSRNRRLPKDHFLKIMNALLKMDSKIKFILIGGKDDAEYVRSFCDLLGPSKHVLNFCGLMDHEELVYLFERCDLCVGNDSGPLHLAAAAGRPTVSFFGPETPALYGPLGNGHIVFYEDLYCSPCLNVYNAKRDNCKDNKCMQIIEAEKVIEAIRSKYLAWESGEGADS